MYKEIALIVGALLVFAMLLVWSLQGLKSRVSVVKPTGWAEGITVAMDVCAALISSTLILALLVVLFKLIIGE